jgi:prevent-host-death family protein
MASWQASNARLRFAEIVDGAVAGEPQFVQRRDGREVVVVSRDYFERTKPTLKSFLLEGGYSGDGEADFDAALREVRTNSPDILARRGAAADE